MDTHKGEPQHHANRQHNGKIGPHIFSEHPAYGMKGLFAVRFGTSIIVEVEFFCQFLLLGGHIVLISGSAAGKRFLNPHALELLLELRELIDAISARVFRTMRLAFRADLTSAPKVSKSGQSLVFAIWHYPSTTTSCLLISTSDFIAVSESCAFLLKTH